MAPGETKKGKHKDKKQWKRFTARRDIPLDEDDDECGEWPPCPPNNNQGQRNRYGADNDGIAGAAADGYDDEEGEEDIDAFRPDSSDNIDDNDQINDGDISEVPPVSAPPSPSMAPSIAHSNRDRLYRPAAVTESGEGIGKAAILSASSSSQGRFHANEDRCRADLAVKVMTTAEGAACAEHGGMCLFTMCDGHDGSKCAEFVCKHIGKALFGRLLDQSSPQAIERSFVEAFHEMEDRFAEEKCPSSGACVLCVLIVGDRLYCANLGDCRAAWVSLADSNYRNTAADNGGVGVFRSVYLSRDFRASDKDEIRRIQRLGGRVMNGRVAGILEPSRTIGDFDVKNTQPAGAISTVPEIRVHQMDTHGMLLIATDGVWESLSAADVCDRVLYRHKLLLVSCPYLQCLSVTHTHTHGGPM